MVDYKDLKHSFLFPLTIAFTAFFALLLVFSIIGYYAAGGTYVDAHGYVHENFQYIAVGIWSAAFVLVGLFSLLIQKIAAKHRKRK